jgi:hypothetical protein
MKKIRTDNEKKQLIFKYIQLAVANPEEKVISSEMKEIQDKLGLSHKEIIKAAAKDTT